MLLYGHWVFDQQKLFLYLDNVSEKRFKQT